MKNILNILILSICLLAGILHAGAKPVKLPDSSFCLELNGKVTNFNRQVKGNCRIVLTQEGTASDSFILKRGRQTFNTFLKKNTSYTLTVSMKGYASKKILIDTRMASLSNNLYRFYFDTSLDPLESARGSAADEFPVAYIYFDTRKHCFYYNKPRRIPLAHTEGRCPR